MRTRQRVAKRLRSAVREEFGGEDVMHAPLFVRTDQDRAQQEQVVVHVGMVVFSPQPVVLNLADVE